MTIKLPLFVPALALIVGLAGCDNAVSKSASSKTNDEISQLNNGESCDMLAGNAKDICEKDADGRKWVDAAEFAATSEPSDQHTYELKIARADAASLVAQERCDDLAGNPEDVCRKEAKRAHETAKADATLQLKLSDASATARETTIEANEQAAETSEVAREEAADAKHDAALSLAREQCDRFANVERQDCLKSAEATYAKN